MYFIGIDLAWSEKNPTAICILDDTPEILDLQMRISNESILSLLSPYLENRKIMIGIDAPLIIQNQSGQRQTERDFLKDFSVYKLGVHAVNRNLMLRYGDPIRSEALFDSLKKSGFSMNPDSIHFCAEVYPHATILSCFNQGKVLPYKKKPNRTWEEVKVNLTILQDYMAKVMHSSDHEIFTTSCHDMRPKELKDFEDRLDSIVCAYTMWYWKHHRGSCISYGDGDTGLLIAPKPPAKNQT